MITYLEPKRNRFVSCEFRHDGYITFIREHSSERYRLTRKNRARLDKYTFLKGIDNPNSCQYIKVRLSWD